MFAFELSLNCHIHRLPVRHHHEWYEPCSANECTQPNALYVRITLSLVPFVCLCAFFYVSVSIKVSFYANYGCGCIRGGKGKAIDMREWRHPTSNECTLKLFSSSWWWWWWYEPKGLYLPRGLINNECICQS